MNTVTLSRAEVVVSEALPTGLTAKTLRVLTELRNWRMSPTDWSHVGPLLQAHQTAVEARMSDDADVLTETLESLCPPSGLAGTPDTTGMPAGLRDPLGELVRLLEDPYRSENSTPRSDSGRAPKIRRSLSSIGRSLMLASRRVIKP